MKKDLSSALQLLAEHLNGIDGRLSRLEASLAALKAVLSLQLNPANPKQALDQIQTLEESFQKLDPNAEARKKFAEAIELVKMVEKHGPPKDA